MKSHLQTLTHGSLTLHTANGTAHFGESAELSAHLYVHHPRFFHRAVLGGRLSIAESYLQGDWDCDDLTSLFRIFVRNHSSAQRFDRGLARLSELGNRLYHAWHANTRAGSRRNIAAHYDLGNDFYKLWLDDTLAYSSGIFADAGFSLREASLEKFDRVCRKLHLEENDEVIEIGTGWGGFALHAVQNYGCDVTTTTISGKQHAVARQRFDQAALGRKIQLLQQDYRDLHGQFDKLVSIEMIEAVGHRYLDGFFGTCSRLLRADGTMVLQAIVMPEQQYTDYLKSVDFIQRYVFPGGCLPTVGSMLASAGRATDLRLVHVEDFAPHYAETLRRWRRSFQDQLGKVRELGYPEMLIRLWNYYLCYCEAAFEERSVGVVQIQFDKPRCRRDPLVLSRRAATVRHPSASMGLRDCATAFPMRATERSDCVGPAAIRN
ncbi:MAG TPA: cyclopropane-fatty-acyl-phospholipid synthase family protein [Planctomycetaceae bacterium]|nr:cyclopropane-fatty-acyl-phospholipid synthase family protein [Planctomycetaceae bacterium]